MLFCSLCSDLVQLSPLVPPGCVFSASVSLEIAAQRLVSITWMHQVLDTTSAGCLVARGELKGNLWNFPLPWSGERILEVPRQVQCRHYVSSTHTTPPMGRKYLSFQKCLGLSPVSRLLLWRLAVLLVASSAMIGPLASIKAIDIEIGLFCLSLHNNVTSETSIA